MKIYVFGNEDLVMDSMPLKILPELRSRFPQYEFIAKDPNEEWDDTYNMVIIDTVLGIKEITIYDDLKSFMVSPKYSLHDFDAYTNLVFLDKLGRIEKLKIIGLPPIIAEVDATEKVSAILSSISP